MSAPLPARMTSFISALHQVVRSLLLYARFLQIGSSEKRGELKGHNYCFYDQNRKVASYTVLSHSTGG